MKCAVCDKEIEDDSFQLINGVGITCLDCYTTIDDKSKMLISDTRSTVEVFLYVTAVLIFVVGFIVGIVLGNTYQITKENSIDSLLEPEKEYNTLLAFCVWIGTFISGMNFIALGKIVSLLDKISNKQ